MASFTRYPSISNYGNSKIESMCETVPQDEEWIVTEKLHGANFQFWTNGQEVKLGTRNKYVTPFDEVAFHNCGKVGIKVKPKILELFKEFTDCKEMIVFGELFGGSYVGFPQTSKPVQKEILYCPNVNFAAFEIEKDGKLLSKVESLYLLKKHEILCVFPIFNGNFKEAMEFSIQNYDKPSDAYRWLGLDPITNVPNIREGHVIQPNNTYYSKQGDRVIIKHKNEFWSESRTSNPTSKISNHTNPLMEAAINMITANRLKNIISQGDILSSEPFQKFIGPMVKDIIKEMETQVDEKELHGFQKLLSKEVQSRLKDLLIQVNQE